jgi:hypothetical protein
MTANINLNVVRSSSTNLSSELNFSLQSNRRINHAGKDGRTAGQQSFKIQKIYNVFGASSTENPFVNGGIAQIGELYTKLASEKH